MFAGRSCVLLGFFLLAHRVVLVGLMMMVCGSVVVRGGKVMVFTRRMMLRFVRHWEASPSDRSEENRRSIYIETKPGCVSRQRRTQHLDKCTPAVAVPIIGLWTDGQVLCRGQNSINDALIQGLGQPGTTRKRRCATTPGFFQKMFHGTRYSRDGLSPRNVRRANQSEGAYEVL
jgi:hypothetical protein